MPQGGFASTAAWFVQTIAVPYATNGPSCTLPLEPATQTFPEESNAASFAPVAASVTPAHVRPQSAERKAEVDAAWNAYQACSMSDHANDTQVAPIAIGPFQFSAGSCPTQLIAACDASNALP